MIHDELIELVPAYALDAVSEEEEIHLRSHFIECSECARLFEFHSETAGMLALATEPAVASAGRREEVLARARNEGQVRSTIAAEPAPVAQSPSKPWTPTIRRRSWMPRVAGLATAAALLFAAVGGWMTFRLRAQNELLNRQQQALGVIASADVDVVPMREGDGAAGAQGQVFIEEGGAQAAVLVKGLRDSGDKTYALWLVRDGGPVPIENFEPDEKGEAVLLVDEGVRPSNVMAVTLEPREGTKKPEGPTVLST